MRLVNGLITIFLCGSMYANTYYVSPTGNDSANGTSQQTSWKTIARLAKTSFSTGDQILFQCGGTWREELDVPASGLTIGSYGTGAKPVITGANLISSGWTSSGTNVWSVSLSVTPTQVWFNGSLGIQQSSTTALVGANEWFYGNGKLSVYSTSNPSSAQVEAAQRDFAVAIDDVSNVTVTGLHLSKGNAFTVYVGDNAGGTQTFQSDVWDGSPGEGVMVLNGQVNITGSIGHDNLLGLGVYGGTGLTMTNSILSGNRDVALWIADTTGPNTVSGSTVSGNVTLYNLDPVIRNDGPSSLTVSNSILLPNPYGVPGVESFIGMRDDGTNVQKSPVFTARATPLIILPYVDDYANLSVAQAVASAAETYGFHITYALNTGLVTSEDWPTIAQLAAQGHEIAAHTRSHSDLNYLNVFTIKYTGPAAAATMTINIENKTIQTFLNGSTTPDYNYSIPAFYPADWLCNDINSMPNYSCSMTPVQSWWTNSWSSQTYVNPLTFADVTNVNIKTGYVVTVDPTRYYSYEIQGSQSDIEANIPGYTVKTFATPYSSSSDEINSMIAQAGFQLNRNVMNDTPQISNSYMLSNLNLFNISGWTVTCVDLSNVALSVDELVEALGASGGIWAFYAHGYDEFTLAQWDTFFAELKAIGATVMTASEAVTYIQSHGSLVQDGSGQYWNMPIIPAPNYAPTASSPTQGAHITQ
jgi:hypothetical protein